MSIVSDEDLVQKGIAIIEEYRKHPALAAHDLLNVDLATPQRVVLEAMWAKPYTMLVASRGFGKTFILALFSVLRAMLYPGLRIGWISATFRQSKFIFNEADKLYQRSPIFRAACEKSPTRLQESWYIRLKGINNAPGGQMEAVPLGDGNKIRGMRAHIIGCDEFPQIPEEIFNTVVLPMVAVRLDPMVRVRLKERERELKSQGLLGEHESLDLGGDSVNQIIIASSAYFKFNHFYKRYLSYVESIRQGDPRYAVFSIPYYDMPEHFYEQSVIEVSKQQQSSLEFRMEYLAEFVSDSEGFYKASLLESCVGSYTVETHGSPGAAYVIGVDPARTADSCSVVVIRIGDPAQVVYADELKGQTFQYMTDYIFKLALRFNCAAIYMDNGAGGGGTAICDLLEAGNGLENNKYEPIVVVDSGKKGKAILTMVDMLNDWSSETNHKLLNLLEQKQIQFPLPPMNDLDTSETQTEIYEKIRTMRSQLVLIEPQATPTGKVKFDVPKGKGHGQQKKDLYSALILATRALCDLLYSSVEAGPVELATGIVKPHGTVQGPAYTVPSIYKDKYIPGMNDQQVPHRRTFIMPKGITLSEPKPTPSWVKKD